MSSLLVKYINEMKIRLTCSLCSDFFNDAVSISCSHEFCRECIHRKAKTSPVCPVCQINISKKDVRPSLGLGEMVSQYKKMLKDIESSLGAVCDPIPNSSDINQQRKRKQFAEDKVNVESEKRGKVDAAVEESEKMPPFLSDSEEAVESHGGNISNSSYDKSKQMSGNGSVTPSTSGEGPLKKRIMKNMMNNDSSSTCSESVEESSLKLQNAKECTVEEEMSMKKNVSKIKLDSNQNQSEVGSKASKNFLSSVLEEYESDLNMKVRKNCENGVKLEKKVGEKEKSTMLNGKKEGDVGVEKDTFNGKKKTVEEEEDDDDDDDDKGMDIDMEKKKNMKMCPAHEKIVGNESAEESDDDSDGEDEDEDKDKDKDGERNKDVIPVPNLQKDAIKETECSHQNGRKIFRSCEFCGKIGHSKVAGDLIGIESKSGKVVNVTESSQVNSNLIHFVHDGCLEWAPSAYFVGDSVRNLNSELSRSKKLKCVCCSNKGAALGCFLERCKNSFHYTCAKSLHGCAWNEDKYLMLCPDHAKEGFSKKKGMNGETKVKAGMKREKRDVANAQGKFQSTLKMNDVVKDKIGSKDSFKVDSISKIMNNNVNIVLCGSGLDAESKETMAKFESIFKCKVVKYWDESVTHVVAGVDELNRGKRTLKFICSIMKGQWIVSVKWLQECIMKRKFVSEDAFEVDGDVYGQKGGPKLGRLLKLHREPNLFHRFVVYFHSDFPEACKRDLITVLEAGGATILPSLAEIYRFLTEKKEDENSRGEILALMFCEAVRWSSKQNSEAQKLDEAFSELKLRFKILPHTWVLDSAAGCSLIGVPKTFDYMDTFSLGSTVIN